MELSSTSEKPLTVTIPHLALATGNSSQISLHMPVASMTMVSSSSANLPEIRPKLLPAPVKTNTNSAVSDTGKSGNNNFVISTKSAASSPNSSSNNNANSNSNNSNSKSLTNGGLVSSFKLDVNKLSDCKVSDLRAELKKRNLPVSGSKPQLIERLKGTDLSLQDSNISTTSSCVANGTQSGSNSVANSRRGSSSNGNVVVKSEVLSSPDEQPECIFMDTSENTKNPVKKSTSGDKVKVSEGEKKSGRKNGKIVVENNNSCSSSNSSGALNAAMLAMLAKGVNVVNAGGQGPMISCNDNGSGGNNVSSSDSTDGKGGILVNETIIMEQQRQIEQLQQALRVSQNQLQQMKNSQQQLESSTVSEKFTF